MKAKHYTVEVPCPHCMVALPYDVTLGRPAPPSSDHDSPAFSDDGDPPEVDGPDICPECKEELNMDDISDTAIELAMDAAEGDTP